GRFPARNVVRHHHSVAAVVLPYALQMRKVKSSLASAARGQNSTGRSHAGCAPLERGALPPARTRSRLVRAVQEGVQLGVGIGSAAYSVVWQDPLAQLLVVP